MSKAYEAPAVKDFGSLKDLTQQSFNKVGSQPDSFTAITNGVVIGSIVNSP